MKRLSVLPLMFLGLLAPRLSAWAETAPYRYVHHPVSTDRAAAQEAFDRGLTLVYGYARDEAQASFRLAAKLDPTLAMAWWGVALALGPDINNDPQIDRTHQAAEALEHADKLASVRATPEERAYIAALKARYSHEAQPDFDQLATGYRAAMRALLAAHPDDADAAALYAEALMDLSPWQLWTANGQPAAQTDELVSMLEAQLAQSPDHLGLLHFYIHAIEASPFPERALPIARRLGAIPLEPAAAHLIHMPAHIYLRTGDWSSAIESNTKSVHHALDFRHGAHPMDAVACGHCLDFLRHAYTMAGNLEGARKSAEQYESLSEDPTTTLGVLARFGQWDEILIRPAPSPVPPGGDGDVHFATGYWHYARGVALVATGRLDAADHALTALRQATADLAPPRVLASGALGIEHALDDLLRRGSRATLVLAAQILEARLSAARQGAAASIPLWRAAVDLQDQLPYSEPPLWYYPVRESLGAALLRAGLAKEAADVFSEDLHRNPNNPRSLFGLAAARKSLRQKGSADSAQQQFEMSWKLADQPLSLSDL